jgi:hypothetical protein
MLWGFYGTVFHLFSGGPKVPGMTGATPSADFKQSL